MHDKKPLDYKEIAIIKGYKYSSKMKMTICKKYTGSSYNHSLDQVIKGAKGTVNTEKLDYNLSRAKNAVFELAMCNPWRYWGTFTMDKEMNDRNDLKGYYKKFTQWIRNYNKKHNIRIRYLFVPEKHKKGTWHMHGFLYGLPEEHLVPFKNGDKSKNGKPIPMKLWKNGYLNWPAYAEKFGYCSFDTINNHEAIAKYLTKYVTKDVESSVKEVNAKSYYNSRGLEKATEYIRGYLAIPVTDKDCDFVNDFVKIIDFERKNLTYVIDNIVPLEKN